jgi:hypothetical protein
MAEYKETKESRLSEASELGKRERLENELEKENLKRQKVEELPIGK